MSTLQVFRSGRNIAVVIGALLMVMAALTAPASASSVRADDGARVVSETWVNSRTVDLTIQSPALDRTAKARLLVPTGWSAGSSRKWPILYLLHGCCDPETYQSWTRSTDVAAYTAKTPALIVTPEAGAVGFYSNWWNHGRRGAPAWEKFHLTELRQILERGYGASQRRAVAGLSMGGFGALSYAARHPGMFRAAASYSGVIDTRLEDAQNSPEGFMQFIGQFTPDPVALWGHPDREKAIWAAHNPADLAPLLRFTPTYVSCGNGQPGPLDPAGTEPDPLESSLVAQNVSFAKRAKAFGVPLTTDFYGPGTHTWPYWERELHDSFPILAKALGVPAPTAVRV